MVARPGLRGKCPALRKGGAQAGQQAGGQPCGYRGRLHVVSSSGSRSGLRKGAP